MRTIYMEDDVVALAEYIGELDAADGYRCWQDVDTQKGYNFRRTGSLEEYIKEGIHSRFIATIVRKSDGLCVGSIFLSPEGTLPDLAIMIYRPHRRNGYATRAFSLGTKYCFEVLGLACVYAGCYQGNQASLRMLERCGFVPHPEGNQNEKHFITGAPIVQLDFVKHNMT